MDCTPILRTPSRAASCSGPSGAPPRDQVRQVLAAEALVDLAGGDVPSEFVLR
ncbi:hypothetical protein ACH47C_13135 [Streptomyces rishiriensis]|uniref:hypothetical protein n=1 Tax=Streptomyces rishiriensis TaxID=68264 RepID=UPI0033DB9563